MADGARRTKVSQDAGRRRRGARAGGARGRGHGGEQLVETLGHRFRLCVAQIEHGKLRLVGDRAALQAVDQLLQLVQRFGVLGGKVETVGADKDENRRLGRAAGPPFQGCHGRLVRPCLWRGFLVGIGRQAASGTLLDHALGGRQRHADPARRQ